MVGFLFFFSSTVLISQAASGLLNNVQCLESRWALPPGGMQKRNFINQTSVCDILFKMVVLTATLPPTSSVVFPSASDMTLQQTQC